LQRYIMRGSLGRRGGCTCQLRETLRLVLLLLLLRSENELVELLCIPLQGHGLARILGALTGLWYVVRLGLWLAPPLLLLLLLCERV
jgi:hypothetical protein